MAVLAQALPVCIALSAAIGQLNDVIQFNGQARDALLLALNAQWVGPEVFLADVL